MVPDAVHSPGQLSQTENCKRGEKLQHLLKLNINERSGIIASIRSVSSRKYILGSFLGLPFAIFKQASYELRYLVSYQKSKDFPNGRESSFCRRRRVAGT